MFSTPLVMEKVPLDSIPLSASSADDVRRDVRIIGELGNRFTYALFIALMFGLSLVLLPKLLPFVSSWLGHPSAVLENLANIAGILGFIIVLGGIFKGAKGFWR